MIERMNQIFENNYINAVMNETAVIVNVGRIFTETVTSVENTLKAYDIPFGETYWNAGLGAYVIPLMEVVK